MGAPSLTRFVWELLVGRYALDLEPYFAPADYGMSMSHASTYTPQPAVWVS
jgi:hypothetical protein